MIKKILLCCGCIILTLGIVGGCGSAKETPTTSAPATIATIVSENVSWEIGDTTVDGTITRPIEGTNLPAILFIAGSGPTDRDWNSPLMPGTNGSAKLLAEALAEKGYITIRYDKRFTGPRAEENLPKLLGSISMQSHQDEIKGAMATLLARNDVNPDRIFILGHSEGTLHAANYYLAPDSHKLAGIIFAGAPGQSMRTLLRAQLAAQLAGFTHADEYMQMFDTAIDSFIDTGIPDIDPDLQQGIQDLINSFANPANLPFTRELLAADFSTMLPQVNIPALIVTGKKDIQIDWAADGGALQTAAGDKSNFTFSFPENANHVLKYEAKEKAEINLSNPGYNAEDATLDTETLGVILAWLDKLK